MMIDDVIRIPKQILHIYSNSGDPGNLEENENLLYI